ncbi:MAG: aldehyde dehydrogenase family protein [Phycisphaerales bacterium]
MMTTQPILLRDTWTDTAASDTFQAHNPATGQALNDRYPVSDMSTLRQLAQAAAEAARELENRPPEQIAGFLRTYADNIDTHREAIAQIAHTETALDHHPRLVNTEMDRTIDQLRQAADAVENRSWVCASIEPDLDLRSQYEPLGGGVLVMGPSNFPLAYNGIAGGDFAAAIAAGNPVIAKGHTLHPGTTRLLAEQALAASKTAGLPEGSVQMFYHCKPEDGLELIRMPEIVGVGFTGSRKAGLSLKKAADETGTPIYLELSSINPIFILPGACESRGEKIAGSIAESMLAASGQQCTSPGLLILPAGAAADGFINTLSTALTETEPKVMLSADGAEHLDESVRTVRDAGAKLLIGGKRVHPDARFEHTLLSIDAGDFLKKPEAFQREMFGTAALIVLCERSDQFDSIIETLEGNLTGSVYSQPEGEDAEPAQRLARLLRRRVGRLLHNEVPTGVSVRPSMVHGGPFPATGHPGFTAVGIPTAIHRFAARRCYDRADRRWLPEGLRDANPTGRMLRRIGGIWTTDDVGKASPKADQRSVSSSR